VTNKIVDSPKDFYSNETAKITEGIRLVMGKDCKIEYKFVNDIAPTVSGKYRYTISKLAK
jgi:phenylacetate-CoA ligase